MLQNVCSSFVCCYFIAYPHLKCNAAKWIDSLYINGTFTGKNDDTHNMLIKRLLYVQANLSNKELQHNRNLLHLAKQLFRVISYTRNVIRTNTQRRG